MRKNGKEGDDAFLKKASDQAEIQKRASRFTNAGKKGAEPKKKGK